MKKMKDVECRSLLINKNSICKDLIALYVVDYLVKCGVLTDQDKSEILWFQSNLNGDANKREEILQKQNEKLIEKLEASDSDKAFQCFVDALKHEESYPWLAKELEKQLEEELAKDLSAKETTFQPVKKATAAHFVPPRVRNLLNRPAKIDEIRRCLEIVGQDKYGWVVVHGMVGSGKSVLAAESVRNLSSDLFSDGIWWHEIGEIYENSSTQVSEQKLLNKMNILWEKMTPTDKSNQSLDIESAKVKLNKFLNHKRSLIVLDDVWSEDVIINFNGIGCPILVTTQDKKIVPQSFSNVHYIDTVNSNGYGLDINESKQLLANWVQTDVDQLPQDDVKWIVDKFKGNPMGLMLVGSDMEQHRNNHERWKFYRNKIEKGAFGARRRNSSGSKPGSSSDFFTLVQLRYESLDEDYQYRFKHFALFSDDIRIPNKVFEVLWNSNKIEVEDFMGDLVDRSLVIRYETDDGMKLYMMHDMILDFLKKHFSTEIPDYHKKLLDSYFHPWEKDNLGQLSFDSFPHDQYIFYFMGYHIMKSQQYSLFPEVFLNLSFVELKVRFSGPSDLLNDYYIYQKCFPEPYQKHLSDFIHFVSENAHLLYESQYDVIQLALCQPTDSIVYQKALKLARSSKKPYFLWRNQSNVKNSILLSMKLHDEACNCAAFSPNQSIIASVGQDKIIKIWNSETGKAIKSLKGHGASINFCQFNFKGNLLATASDDGTVKVWEINYEEMISNDISPKQQSANYPYMFNGNCIVDNSIHTYKHEHLENDDSAPEVKCCSFSSDGRLIVSGGTDRKLYVWCTDTAQLRFKLEYREIKHAIKSCHFSPDDSHIVAATAENVVICSTISHALVHVLKHEMNVENSLYGQFSHVFTASGKYIYKWDSMQKKVMRKYNNSKTPYYVTCCAVSPNEKLIAAGTTIHSIMIWRSNLLSSVATFKGQGNAINWVSFNSDGSKLLSCSDNGTVMVWDVQREFGDSLISLRQKCDVQFTSNVANGDELKKHSQMKVITPDDNSVIRYFMGCEGKEHPTKLFQNRDDHEEISCCALSSEGLQILYGTTDGKVYLYQVIDKKSVRLEDHSSEVRFCAFTNNDQKFITCSKDSNSDSTFRIYKTIKPLEFTTPKYETNNFVEDMIGAINGCKVFGKGSDRALVWCENGTFFIVDTTTENVIVRGRHQPCDGHQGEDITFADITTSEELIATVSTNKRVTLWRASIRDNTCWELKTLKTNSCLRSCRFSPNGNYLVLGDDNGKIMLMNLHNQSAFNLNEFENSHSEWVRDFAISSDGKLILSVGESIKLWQKEDGKLLQTFKTVGSSMNCVFTSPDFKIIVTVDDAGILYILELINF